MADNVARRANAEANRAKAAAEQARAEAAKAAAEQARIGAEIAKAEAEARAAAAASAAQLERMRVEGRAAREAEAAANRQREAEAAQKDRERLWSTGMLVAPGLAGIAYGLHKAKKANAAHAETMRAGAPHLATLGIQAQKIMSGARGGVLNATARQRLGGTVKAATDLGLMRVRTPIGPAGIMLAEGLALRAGALLLPEGVSKELTGDIGTALTLAGGTMIASRGSSAKVLAALSSTGRITAGAVRGLASLNAARNVVRAAPPPAAVNTVAAARRTVAAVQRSTSTAGMVRAGVVRAVGASNLATARRLAVRGGALGAVAALGAVMGQTEAAQSAWAWVTGHYRTNSNGRTAYVAPYQRRVG